ncbi:cell division regulator GpsB [Granulicatella sp. zg-ZJ]|uniref:cell division regulator GpsB n=1 Tax=unclassified Granulicatella TaxID=2630493 RepID=UPI0013C26215|nr:MULTISPECIES: cell division regulator GpsB [unclassified Granulicatella]MBS4749511.1 cell division regulator GpsB [Carnobacteriaceae bacterium zg-ZUI78]NEW62233.1 cell division regulator GpsB [Granulicatella sp. zg-ZJ]NEW65703.1 cell division regulator GpsB [Granulicatella sp. zg-84]QMI86543.1 cell division regulator GpsB [Carnobacteriaceae bacterium zg-84]
MAKRNLTPQDIYDQAFKTSMRGYNTVEVDEFLDLIMQDYDMFETELAKLKQENIRLINKIGELSEKNGGSDAKPQTSSAGTTNYDILRRISNLEKHVFGSKLDNVQ